MYKYYKFRMTVLLIMFYFFMLALLKKLNSIDEFYDLLFSSLSIRALILGFFTYLVLVYSESKNKQS